MKPLTYLSQPTIFIGILLLASILFGCRELPPAGQIAYVGGDGNVYVTSADLETTTQITFDANTRIEGAGRSYQRLAWSPAGQLAYASVERSGEQASSEIYVTNMTQTIPSIVGSSADHFVIYMNWAAGSCGKDECNRLAYLIEEGASISLRVVDLDPMRNRVAGTGWPFYASWSPDGEQMLWHRNGGILDNSVATLDLFDVAAGESAELPIKPGLQVAPAFSPTGEGMVLVSAENNLLLINGDQQTTIAEGDSADISYVWSPDGTQIAYAIRRQLREPFFDAIHVYDVATGESRRIIDMGLRSQGFFWSPDGRQLAYIQWLPIGEEEGWMQWRVVNVETGEDRGFEPFNPTPQFRFMMASFTQFAQSHRLWSPDSRYLLFTERRASQENAIWMLDTQSDSDNGILVAEGSLAFWSWR
ncbi:MAG: hypothetical protein ACPG8W_15865 [Candidatus Promineifilaceae bacterium]